MVQVPGGHIMGLDDVLDGLHSAAYARNEVTLYNLLNFALAFEGQQDLAPLQRGPRAHDLHFHLDNLVEHGLLLHQSLAQPQRVFVPFGLPHEQTEGLVQFHEGVGKFEFGGELVAVGTVALHLEVLVVPEGLALVAELGRADALHVRAADLLLDGLAASGTLSRVIFDPADIGLFGIYDFPPPLHLHAAGRRVRLLLAPETVHFSAGAVYHRYLHQARLRAEVRALFVGAVAHVFVLDRIAHADFFAVELFQLCSHALHEASEHRRLRAGGLVHTAEKDVSRLQLSLDIPSPTVLAIFVSAHP